MSLPSLLISGPSDMRNAAAAAHSVKAVMLPIHRRANDRARGETRMSKVRISASAREFRHRFLTLIANGPIRVKPLLVRISKAKTVYSRAAATSIHTNGVSARGAADGL